VNRQLLSLHGVHENSVWSHSRNVFVLYNNFAVHMLIPIHIIYRGVSIVHVAHVVVRTD
jgi:hypothetical protein